MFSCPSLNILFILVNLWIFATGSLYYSSSFAEINAELATFCRQDSVKKEVEAVKAWDRFETAVSNPKAYEDPFRDVTLNVTYTRPDGETVDFWGFYERDSTWKIRFMPDTSGTWHYSATFSDGSKGISGSFECESSDLPGLITQHQTNPIWFGFPGGEPVLVRSFHVGDRFFASNWPASKRNEFLDWAQMQGYNMLSIASHYLNRDEKDRGHGWETPDLWDDESRALRPNEYEKMEAILNDLADRRIMVFPFAGFFGKSSDFPVNQADQELYVRYTLARLAPYWNTLFNVSGPEPLQTPVRNRNHRGMDWGDIRRLGSLIASLDPFAHLVSIHNPPGDDPFRNEPWLGYSTLQGGKGSDWPNLNHYILRNHTGSQPIYAQEVFWPGNMYHRVEGEDIRKKAYVLLFSAATINFADMDGNSSTGFSGTMDPEDCHQGWHDRIKQVWDWFETIPYHRLRPHQDLVNHGFCLANVEELEYYVYLPEGGTVDFRVIQWEDQEYEATWINGKNTKDVRQGVRTSNGRNLTAPDNEDWILHLTIAD